MLLRGNQGYLSWSKSNPHPSGRIKNGHQLLSDNTFPPDCSRSGRNATGFRAGTRFCWTLMCYHWAIGSPTGGALYPKKLFKDEAVNKLSFDQEMTWHFGQEVDRIRPTVGSENQSQTCLKLRDFAVPANHRPVFGLKKTSTGPLASEQRAGFGFYYGFGPNDLTDAIFSNCSPTFLGGPYL